MNEEKNETGILSDKLTTDPELLKQQPELFQQAVMESLALMNLRLKELEEKLLTSLIK
jgi:hypothetical protein